MEMVRLLALGEDSTHQFATAPPMVTAFFPQASNQWCGAADNPECITLDLTEWVGNPNIQIVFESYNGFGNNLFIDNVSIEGTLSYINDINTPINNIAIYPNPSNGKLNITLEGFDEEVTLQVFDVNGRVVLSDKIECDSPTSALELNVGFLNKGLYLVSFRSANGNFTEKIIIK
jgi:hypothetical protein